MAQIQSPGPDQTQTVGRSSDSARTRRQVHKAIDRYFDHPIMTDDDDGPFGPLDDLDDLDLMAESRVLLDLSSAAKRLRLQVP